MSEGEGEKAGLWVRLDGREPGIWNAATRPGNQWGQAGPPPAAAFSLAPPGPHAAPSRSEFRRPDSAKGIWDCHLKKHKIQYKCKCM